MKVIRQRTCKKDPWTWTTVWGLAVEVVGKQAEAGKEGKVGTIVTA